MCGIFGEVGLPLVEKDSFLAINDLNFLRGPDASGYWTDEKHCQFGFRRLAILDLTPAGNQPMLSPDGRWVMVFNGEIYNFRDIQNKLGLRQEDLRSHSDSEVLIHAFQQWGPDKTAGELNGIFAIGLYNREEKVLYLIRDFAGIKPLYYGFFKDKIVFGSQYNQVFKHPSFLREREINPGSLNDFIRLGYIPAKEQFFKHTFQVLPGTIVKFTPGNGLQEIPFYQYRNAPGRGTILNETSAEALREFNEVFDDVVHSQLISDVSIGAFLSGGIDSPLVAARARKYQHPLHTFTIGVNGEMDESAIAQQYARILKVNNTTGVYDKEILVKEINEHFAAFTEPFGDYSSLPSFQVCKMARQNFTVALSGDGGDEIFWGYPRFLSTINHYSWFKYPPLIRRLWAGIRRKTGKKISYGIHNEDIGTWVLEQQSHNKSHVLEDLLPGTQASGFTRELYHYKGPLDREHLLYWLRWNEFYGHLQRVLVKVDRTSMANSLEVRVPFLDKHILGFSALLIPELNNGHTKLKYILKKALAQDIPEEALNKQKMGFSIPIESFMRNELRAEILDLLTTGQAWPEQYFNQQALSRYVNDFMEGESDNSWGIWHLYALQKWYRMHVIA